MVRPVFTGAAHRRSLLVINGNLKMKDKNNLHLVLEYLTRQDPRAQGGFMVQDDNDGNGPFIAGWFEPNLGPQPTQEEIDAAEDDAVEWGGQKSIDAGVFYGQLALGAQAQLSALSEVDPIVKTFKDFMSMSGAKIRPLSDKTRAAVMYLAGVEMNGQTISKAIFTVEDAELWLSQSFGNASIGE